MAPEDVRAEACARLRKVSGPDDRGKALLGHTGGGWWLEWTNGEAAIFRPDTKGGRAALPERFAALMAGEPGPLQWQPYAQIAQAVHVLQAVARGLRTQHVQLRPEPAARGDGGRLVLHYADAAYRHEARAWGDATFYAPSLGGLDPADRARVLADHAPTVALPYLAALLWADTTGWVIRRADLDGLPVVLFHAPECRVIVAEVKTDEQPAGPAEGAE